MITNPKTNYRIEWRSYAQKRWVPMVACREHIQSVIARVPVKILDCADPKQECELCRAALLAKKSPQSEKQIPYSPIPDTKVDRPFKPKLLRN